MLQDGNVIPLLHQRRRMPLLKQRCAHARKAGAEQNNFGVGFALALKKLGLCFQPPGLKNMPANDHVSGSRLLSGRH